MARQLTVRRVPDPIARRLDRLSKEKGKSVNATVLEILESAVGVQGRRDLLESQATWTERDVVELDAVVAGQRVIDDSLWR